MHFHHSRNKYPSEGMKALWKRFLREIVPCGLDGNCYTFNCAVQGNYDAEAYPSFDGTRGARWNVSLSEDQHWDAVIHIYCAANKTRLIILEAQHMLSFWLFLCWKSWKWSDVQILTSTKEIMFSVAFAYVHMCLSGNTIACKLWMYSNKTLQGCKVESRTLKFNLHPKRSSRST